MKPRTTIAQTIGRFAAGPTRITDEMRRFVHYSLFDWATVGIAGAREPVARAARKMALDNAACETAATLFGGGKATAAAAALANGTTSHALDYDDTHFGHIGHPSVVVIPAALAVAETHASHGARFMDACAIGLETACRIGAWLGRPHYEAGFHQTATSGAFGATVAAGRVIGLDADAMAQALSLTATRAAGLKSQFGTMGKPLNAGFAAEVGVTSALLAGAGATSIPQAIEGVQGFGPTHAGIADAAAFDGLGADWTFPQISYKFHACCHGLHAMLEALRVLKADLPGPEAVEAVTVRTHPRWLAVCNQLAPATGLAAKFSYRLTAAMMLADVDTAMLDVYSAATCADEELLALRDRVTVIGDDSVPDTATAVSVRMAGGVVERRFDIVADRDDAAVPDRLTQKSVALLGAEASNALAATVGAAGTPGGIAELAARLRVAPSQTA